MSVAACPKCSEKVTLPPGAPAEAKVRCPLCGENYLLSEAMSSLPPLLEIVELPDGFSLPASDVSIAASAFRSAPSRTPLPGDDGGEFRLQGEPGGVATIDGAEPRYDAWGSVSSSTPAHEAAATPRERFQVTPRKKRKEGNPIMHVLGIVAGGLLAFPLAFLILLWLPGSLQRDPANLGPWLGRNVPFLAPANFRAQPSDGSDRQSTSGGEAIASKANKPAIDARPLPSGKGNDNKPGDSNSDDTQPALIPDDEMPTEQPTLVPEDPLTSEPDSTLSLPDVEPTLKIPVAPLDAPPPKADDAKPETPAVDASPDESPAQPTRAALLAADKAFNEATVPAEKRSAAIALYQAAAEHVAGLTAAQDDEALAALATDPMKLQFVGVYAGTWLDNKDRGSQGIVLSGSVKSCQAAGDRFELRIELPSRDKRELVVSSPIECQEGDKVFVAGQIAENAEGMPAVDAHAVKVVGQ